MKKVESEKVIDKRKDDTNERIRDQSERKFLIMQKKDRTRFW